MATVKLSNTWDYFNIPLSVATFLTAVVLFVRDVLTFASLIASGDPEDTMQIGFLLAGGLLSLLFFLFALATYTWMRYAWSVPGKWVVTKDGSWEFRNAYNFLFLNVGPQSPRWIYVDERAYRKWDDQSYWDRNRESLQELEARRKEFEKILGTKLNPEMEKPSKFLLFAFENGATVEIPRDRVGSFMSKIGYSEAIVSKLIESNGPGATRYASHTFSLTGPAVS